MIVYGSPRPTYKLPEVRADLFSRHASRLDVYVLWRSTEEEVIQKMLCPTRFVVDATKNSKGGGVAAEVSAPRLAYEQNQKATY